MMRRAASSLLALAFLGVGPLIAQQILLVSPAQPSSADPVTVYLSVVHCGFRVETVVQGNTFYLTPNTSLPCPPLPFPLPGLVTQVTIGPLAAGSYELVVRTLAGQTTDSRAFFVHQPTSQLSLLDGRFAASVTWSDADGAGTGQAVQLSDASGYFWFFDPGTLELTVKVIDGTAINGHFWVFVSSATDVAFTLTVADTWLCPAPPGLECPVRSYQGQAGTNRNFFDLTSFSFFPP